MAVAISTMSWDPSTQSQVSQECYRRPYSFPAAIDQVRRDVGQALFPRSNRARENPFHELKLSRDGLKWIAPVGTQRTFRRVFDANMGSGSGCFDFCFVNQIGSGRRKKASAKMSQLSSQVKVPVSKPSAVNSA